MKKVLIAGGLCGATMLIAAENLRDSCERAGIEVNVIVHNLWDGSLATGAEYDVIVEMFAYFENMKCPVLSGKPFIGRMGEKELIAQIIGLLQQPKQQAG